jgi:hypothetical protein
MSVIRNERVVGTGPIQTYTWATKPAASAVPLYSEIWVSDVGIVPVKFFSDGTYWQSDKTINLDIRFSSCILHSFQAANASSYSQVGTLITVTSTAHLLLAALNGARIYLSPSSGTLIAGWYTDFLYIDADHFSCVSTISQTISGNLLSLAGINVAVAQFNTILRGGLMGKYGRIEEVAIIEGAGSGSKVFHGFGFATANGTINIGLTSTNKSARVFSDVMNTGVENAQMVLLNVSTGFGISANTPFSRAIDTASDYTLQSVLQVANASEWIALHGRRLSLFRKT